MASKKKELLRIVERLDDAGKTDVLMFAEMVLHCQRLNIEPMTANEWDAITQRGKVFVVEVLKRATGASSAYMNLLMRKQIAAS